MTFSGHEVGGGAKLPFPNDHPKVFVDNGPMPLIDKRFWKHFFISIGNALKRKENQKYPNPPYENPKVFVDMHATYRRTLLGTFFHFPWKCYEM